MNFREFRHRLFGIVLTPLAVFGPFSFIRVWANKLRGVTIKKGVWIGYLAFIDQPPDVKESLVEIHEGVGVGFRNNIFAHDSSPVWRGEKCVFKKVVIEKNVYLGANVTIMPGVRIGEGAVVGACSLVNKDVPPYTVVAGVPAKPIKKIIEKDGKKLVVPLE
ncbi:acyltransferase [Candidatus Micrarchaeota archaeon]|nr:acyltransferase [Candidatus Micrarchaeota archaeon]